MVTTPSLNHYKLFLALGLPLPNRSTLRIREPRIYDYRPYPDRLLHELHSNTYDARNDLGESRQPSRLRWGLCFKFTEWNFQCSFWCGSGCWSCLGRSWLLVPWIPHYNVAFWWLCVHVYHSVFALREWLRGLQRDGHELQKSCAGELWSLWSSFEQAALCTQLPRILSIGYLLCYVSFEKITPLKALSQPGRPRLARKKLTVGLSWS